MMDKQTYIDLEIFESDDGKPGLFNMLDKTITQSGSWALKRRFSNPLKSIDEIKEVQNIVRYFLLLIDEWKLSVNESNIKSVEQYIHSNIIVFRVTGGFTDWLTAKRFKWNQPDYFHFLKSGIVSLLEFLQKIHSFLQPHINDDTPKYLVNLFHDNNTLLLLIQKEANIRDNNIHSMNSLSVLKTDYMLRHDQKENIINLLSSFYEVDALFAMANSCKEYNLHIPEIVSGNNEICLKGLRHLFIENPVTNDLIISKQNFVFLTGPNMAGKTVFIKAAATAVFLAHLGMGIPSTGATISLFDEIFSSINIADNLRKGESFFLAEILRLKELGNMLQSGKKSICCNG